MTSTEEIIEISPEAIIDIISDGAEIYSSITTNFIQKFIFYEKTLYEWATFLMIE